MKLNHDLVRSLLLFIEDCEGSSRGDVKLLEFTRQHEISKGELSYVVRRLEEADFIGATFLCASDEEYCLSIDFITWKGHEYLGNIHDPEVWEFAKSVTSQFTSVSLEVLGEVAKSHILKRLRCEPKKRIEKK